MTILSQEDTSTPEDTEFNIEQIETLRPRRLNYIDINICVQFTLE